MLKHLILATAATALIAVPVSAKHRHHRYDPRILYGYAIPAPVYGYVPYRYGVHSDRWMRTYRHSPNRDGYWSDRRHDGNWRENDQGENNDDQGEDEDD